MNSHPFQYNNWIFAHNGSVEGSYLPPLLDDKYEKKNIGQTDSEVFFYWILQCIEKQKNVVEGIRVAIQEVIKGNYTGLNFLLSNGKNLYAFRYSHHDCDRNKYSLFKFKRDPSECGPEELKSKVTGAEIRSKSLRGERAVLVCSEDLTEEN